MLKYFTQGGWLSFFRFFAIPTLMTTMAFLDLIGVLSLQNWTIPSLFVIHLLNLWRVSRL